MEQMVRNNREMFATEGSRATEAAGAPAQRQTRVDACNIWAAQS